MAAGGKGKALRSALALGVFSLAAVLMTYPVAWKLGEGLAGDGADANLFVWNHWWFGKAVSEGRDPYSTDVLYWPTGTSLVLHTFSPYHAALSLGLAPWLGHVAAYNVLVLASFALAAWGGYLAARELTGSEAGAYVAGFAFGFTGYHYAHALGHLNLVAYQWLAFFLLFFVRYVRTARRRHAFLAALTIVGAGLTDYALLLTLALFAFTLSVFVHGWRNPDAYLRVLLPGAMAALMFSPWIGLVLREYVEKPELKGYGEEAGRYSLDAFSYLWPTPLSTLYEDVGRVLPENGTTTEATAFLGFLVVALAAVALALRPWAATRPWALTGLVFYVLSLGPRLQVWGHATGVPLPYAAFHWIPLLDTLRTPARFSLAVILCASILAAMGLASLLERFPLRLRRAAPLAAALVCAVVLAESVVVPFPVTPLRHSPLYEDAKALEPEALVDLPLHQPGYAGQLGRVNFVAAQTLHGIPIVNGYNARETSRDVQTMLAQQTLKLFHHLEIKDRPLDAGDVFPDQDARLYAGDLLARRGMTALLLHKSDPPTPVEAEEETFLDSLPGLRRVKEAPDGILYEAFAREPPPPVLLDLGAGWHGLESFDGVPSRWTFRSPQVLVHAAEAGNATLAFRISPFLPDPDEPRTLQVVVEGRVALERALRGGWETVELNVTLAQGTNLVTLHSVEDATSPQRARVGGDSRPLAFAVQDVRLRIAAPGEG